MAGARHPSCALKAFGSDLRRMDALGHHQRGAKDLAALSESGAGSWPKVRFSALQVTWPAPRRAGETIFTTFGLNRLTEEAESVRKKGRKVDDFSEDKNPFRFFHLKNIDFATFFFRAFQPPQ